MLPAFVACQTRTPFVLADPLLLHLLLALVNYQPAAVCLCHQPKEVTVAGQVIQRAGFQPTNTVCAAGLQLPSSVVGWLTYSVDQHGCVGVVWGSQTIIARVHVSYAAAVCWLLVMHAMLSHKVQCS